MDDSAIICDEVIESYDKEIKTIPTNFKQNFYICIFMNYYNAIDT